MSSADSSEHFDDHVIDDLHEIKTVVGFNLFFLICIMLFMIVNMYLLNRTKILEQQIKETKELIVNDANNQRSMDMNPVVVPTHTVDTEDTDLDLTHDGDPEIGDAR